LIRLRPATSKDEIETSRGVDAERAQFVHQPIHAMRRPRVLLICGSMNQTTQMHKIAMELGDHECFFTTYYGSPALELANKVRLTESSVRGYKLSARAQAYLDRHGVACDQGGRNGPYDLVVTCSDQVTQPNIRHVPIVLVQEGMTDPEGPLYQVWKRCRWFPR